MISFIFVTSIFVVKKMVNVYKKRLYLVQKYLSKKSSQKYDKMLFKYFLLNKKLIENIK